MTQRTSTIEEDRRRELFLEAAVRDWRQHILRDARQAVERVDVGNISPTSLQGLVNAAGSGPGRHRPTQRLDSLKRYLAWRKHQADESDPWLQLADQITQDLTALEEQVEQLLDRASQRYALDPLELPERSAVLRDLHLKLTEIYLHALANYYEHRRA
jgi:hypothetical protein